MENHGKSSVTQEFYEKKESLSVAQHEILISSLHVTELLDLIRRKRSVSALNALN